MALGILELICTVVFWFGGKGAQGRDFSNTELNIGIERISRLSRDAEQEVRRKILRSLCDLQDSALGEILSKRVADQATKATA